MAKDPAVYVMGLGVPDPKGVFGTTTGLQQKYGPTRVMDMPASENAMTGVAIGSALAGRRPVLVHQRLDFALLAVEQMVNQAAKWRYMFGGKMSVPLVVRMVVGRGWGQGPQHSQCLHAWFAHVPGLKVLMPASPHDAKGLLVAALEQNDPVIYIEHRWLHHITGHVPENLYSVPIGAARILREGDHLTIVASSLMALEAARAAQTLEQMGIFAEVIDLRTIKPLDTQTILDSVRKTGRLLVADTGHSAFGVAAEVLALAAEHALDKLKAPPRRLALPDCPVPTSPALAKHVYHRVSDIVSHAQKLMGWSVPEVQTAQEPNLLLDVPDPGFTGPF